MQVITAVHVHDGIKKIWTELQKCSAAKPVKPSEFLCNFIESFNVFLIALCA